MDTEWLRLNRSLLILFQTMLLIITMDWKYRMLIRYYTNGMVLQLLREFGDRTSDTSLCREEFIHGICTPGSLIANEHSSPLQYTGNDNCWQGLTRKTLRKSCLYRMKILLKKRIFLAIVFDRHWLTTRKDRSVLFNRASQDDSLIPFSMSTSLNDSFYAVNVHYAFDSNRL